MKDITICCTGAQKAAPREQHVRFIKIKHMYLSKLWNKSKGPILPLLATIIPSIGGIWSFDFQKLSPDITLSSQAIYNTRVELTIWFLLIVAFLLSCVFIYSVIATINDRKSLKNEVKNIIKSIKETTENNYTIHQRDSLSPSISKAMDEEAAKGFNLPQGSLAGRLFDIHLNEISVYSSIIQEASLSFASNNDINFSSPEFIKIFNDLLIAHNTKIKNYHNPLITNLFDRGNSTHTETMVDRFNKQAEVETKLRFKELLSTLKVKSLSSCDEMVFPPWVPIEIEKPKPHVYESETEG